LFPFHLPDLIVVCKAWHDSLRIAEFRRENLGYEGGIDNPMSWDRVVEKFHCLSEQFADPSLRNELIHAVQELDAKPISALLDLLGMVRPTATFRKTHHGIQ
jgi:2-methylcitrate dehydratase